MGEIGEIGIEMRFARRCGVILAQICGGWGVWRFVGRFIEVMEMGGNGSGMRKVELLCEHLDEDFGNYWGCEQQGELGQVQHDVCMEQIADFFRSDFGFQT